MWKDYKEFISRGNVLDLAIGIVIGAAFSKIVTTLVEGIIMPPIGWLTSGIDFKDKFYDLSGKYNGVSDPKVIEEESEAVRRSFVTGSSSTISLYF